MQYMSSVSTLGAVANITSRGLWSSGMHTAIEHYRGRQVVWDGVVQTGTDANGNPIYEQNTTPIVLDATTLSEKYYAVSSNFIEDGSYIRLQYVTLGYDFAKLMKNQNVLKLNITNKYNKTLDAMYFGDVDDFEVKRIFKEYFKVKTFHKSDLNVSFGQLREIVYFDKNNPL